MAENWTAAASPCRTEGAIERTLPGKSSFHLSFSHILGSPGEYLIVGGSTISLDSPWRSGFQPSSYILATKLPVAEELPSLESSNTYGI